MVSRDLRIRRFTSPAERLLNLLATDIGRPIRDIRGNLDFPDLDRRIEAVIDTLAPEDHEVLDQSGHWYSVRIRPYITVENKIDGAVVALVDVDHVKRAVEQLKEARDRAKAIVETVWQPLVVLDPALRVMRANRAFLRMFGTSQEKVEGRPLPELGPGPWIESGPGRGPADDPHHRPALALSRDQRRSRLRWQSGTASLRLPDRLG